MGTDLYPVDLSVVLEPHTGITDPKVRVSLDNHLLMDDYLRKTENITYDDRLNMGQHIFEIELYDKLDLDSDQSVCIRDFCLCNIADQIFVWQGHYYPKYPEPWNTQQKHAGIDLAPRLSGVNHLGWNGKWQLIFTVPIYTWIHQVQNLGWIYD